MPDLDIYVTIDGDTDLTVDEANGYLVMEVGPGSRTWRRTTETSPFVHDEEEITRTLGPGTVRMVTLVVGSTVDQVNTRTAALIAVLEQITYDTRVFIDGVAKNGWHCRGADTVIGDGGLDARRLAAGRKSQVLTATIPRNPVPFLGPA